MTDPSLCRSLMAAVTLAALATPALADGQAVPSTCKPVHADMVEMRTTNGCKPADTFCFLGEVTATTGFAARPTSRATAAGNRRPLHPTSFPTAACSSTAPHAVSW